MVADTIPVSSPPLAPEPTPAAIPLGDPRQVFGALGGPDSAIPITDDDLAQAYAQLLIAYPDEPGNASIRDAARRAYALTLDRTRWVIQADGTVELIGSAGDTYHVSDDLCTGPSWYNRRTRQTSTICKGSIRAGSSMCYHTIARELLRLAQTFATQPAQDVPQAATVITSVGAIPGSGSQRGKTIVMRTVTCA